MDDQETLNRLMTRAADQGGPPYEAPPAAFFVSDGHHRRGANLKVAAAVLAVLALVVPVTLLANSRAHNQSVANPLPSMGSVTAASLAQYRWSRLPSAPIASRRSAVGLWTGHQMVIWGGASGRDGTVLHADGAAYDPATKTWTSLPPGPLSARAQAASVWTGKSVFIWGGSIDPDGKPATDGALYTPADHRWTRVPTAPVTNYGEVKAFWTGRVIVLLSTPPWDGKPPGEGRGADRVNAQAYDPAKNSWTKLPDLRPPTEHPVSFVVGVSVGNEIYVWSLWSLDTPTGPGSFTTAAGIESYTLQVDKRRWVSNTLALPGHSASFAPLWTGRDLVMPGISTWLGLSARGPSPRNVTGLMLDPATSATLPIRHGPVDDLNAEYVWTGDALLAFNTGTEASDANGHLYPGRAAAWDPTTNTWTRLPNAPLAGYQTVAVWTGTSLLIWGDLFTPRGANPVATTGLEFGP